MPNLYTALLTAWCDALLALQHTDDRWPSLSGGLLCPACSLIHGRCADAVYPLLRMASDTGDSRYLDGAIRLQAWSDHVSLPDGSWLNDPMGHDWTGITVFGALALGEALRHYGHLLEAPAHARWLTRFRAAMGFLDGFMTMRTGNINYPITCAATMAVAANLLDDRHYAARARFFAHESLRYFTDNGLIFGEGHPQDGYSPRGCRPVDLGYNVEESLPALALYGRLTDDAEVLDAVTASLRRHLEFMLPDGGWDNSWGSRNYKWTYWGSRTSDGCQPACALLADRDPRFAEAADRHTQLLAACTHDGLLHGGPHYRIHGELPCIHHTFCHAKALTTVLDYGVPAPTGAPLPRETAAGVQAFPEVLTWLLARGPWRATVTAYDWEYAPEAHATGGALTLLWHPATGPLITAGLTAYRSTIEVSNMQPLREPVNLSLTPQLIAHVEGRIYRSINDDAANVEAIETGGAIVITAHGTLPGSPGAIPFTLRYHVTDDRVTIIAAVPTAPAGADFCYILPIVSAHTEPVAIGDTAVTISKPGGTVRLSSTHPPRIFDCGRPRLFSPVPGHEAIPLVYTLHCGESLEVTITVR
ncbi:MAG TPA: hypothetical protein PK794_09675 [Armatimonadota bacterium]|nr:hypothetical protein [Armatimonadota bacterium]